MYNFFVVSYDLHLDKDYTKIRKAIDKIAVDWIKPLESFYVIKTSLDAEDVRNALKRSTDEDDSIFVIKTDLSDWATYIGNKAIIDRLRSWS